MKKIAGLTLSALMLTSSLGLASVSANGLDTTPENVTVVVTEGTSRFTFNVGMTASVTLEESIITGTSTGTIENAGGTFTNLTIKDRHVLIGFRSETAGIEISDTVRVPAEGLADSEPISQNIDFEINREAALASANAPLIITATATLVSDDVVAQ